VASVGGRWAWLRHAERQRDAGRAARAPVAPARAAGQAQAGAPARVAGQAQAVVPARVAGQVQTGAPARVAGLAQAAGQAQAAGSIRAVRPVLVADLAWGATLLARVVRGQEVLA